jgi:hypothetical protein
MPFRKPPPRLGKPLKTRKTTCVSCFLENPSLKRRLFTHQGIAWRRWTIAVREERSAAPTAAENEPQTITIKRVANKHDLQTGLYFISAGPRKHRAAARIRHQN